MSCVVFARFQSVNRAAIRALAATRVAYVNENLGVVVPHRHARLRAGAEHATLAVQA